MKTSAFTALALAATLFFTGCGTYEARRVTTSQLRSTLGLDPKDVAEVSAEMAESLLSANILRKKGSDGRSIVAISTFRNNTALYDFDPNLMFNRVKVTLNKSGVAYCYVQNDAFVSGRRSAVARENAQVSARNELREFTGSSERESHHSSGPLPQYSLTLELIEDHASLGRTTQKSYQIHMTLNDISRGLEIWEDLRDVSKVGRRAAVGF
jgi:PBP1b-binding outer membrane lipoprotein LpoB